MITAPIAKTAGFHSPRQSVTRPALYVAWLARVSQRLQRRRQADAACLIH
ncbi:hypothetical protein [Phytopseudomonas dryadis]|nr:MULTISPECIES: hypothetical protein [Pseudomonas]